VAAMDDINQHPVVHTWSYKLDMGLHDYDSNHENAELAGRISTGQTLSHGDRQLSQPTVVRHGNQALRCWFNRRPRNVALRPIGKRRGSVSNLQGTRPALPLASANAESVR